jgi:hypothetical protein
VSGNCIHRPPQIAVVTGSEDHVEMVEHQAITEQINRNASADIGHRIDKGIEIAGLVQDRLAPVPPI